MAKSRPSGRIPVDGGGPSLRQPLPGLAGLREKLSSGLATAGETTAEPPAAQPPAAPASEPKAAAASVYARPARIVVRRERKGHGGKTATRIEGLVGSRREIEEAVRELKRSLGCGATRDGADVVVQGAPGERLVAFLESRGARRVVVGS
jgi:translation initiation factor 1 (eIF-1/SUI1)